ncbi:MAG: hypothetical protein P1U62_06660 [Alteraurantiacibacter sp. bin_em_oilr2.035]|uniref:hypothetical protein n=1 Tax=Aurantiacibacter atlanticus TaxID=1648404 RepID=UPI000B262FC8|nr:hypothetical protein [Aurantiacibacter atlanticus]MDF1834550.1 hypothetical protein [Alteraurantiacibacter sp. bin_em_oilr2.035]
MTEPGLARPVFSTEDFGLIRSALATAIKAGEDNEQSRKLVNLHHRLGRFAR